MTPECMAKMESLTLNQVGTPFRGLALARYANAFRWNAGTTDLEERSRRGRVQDFGTLSAQLETLILQRRTLYK